MNVLLTEIVDGNITRFIWLRRFDAGSNSPDPNLIDMVFS